ncbi:hypothetical protein Z957_06540 [Clostridium sp. K25]|uniref:Serine protease n=1 Tax=Clostridium botulinum D str. 1873 TaxID=592027 RepID=A0A9P2G9D7_CLOBO|nr:MULTISPECIES: hypothetical protein [Clostridium]AYF54313.1 hypothetical protein DFH04_06145 [Clostridium novyi]EES92389.1 conserved hypothetical protein [Clostridium botulinum D str. 1873]KEI08666.1 hypothetical protein Z957_06540 [Clostridium sp. K25]MBO3442243.1 serine protease [Clostridium haemolyticum]MCD3246294.1 serine protease [Clostridium botulinum C]
MNNCCTLEEKIKFICECEYKYFFNKANVVAVGLGYKISNGLNTFRKCIKVLVSNKLPKNNLNSSNIIPVCYRGIETDVVESGHISFIKLTERIRPVLGGYSIGPAAKIDGGSMGCVVTDNHDYYILSCNHVLAEDNKIPIGTPVLQPSIFDGGKSPRDIVGSLSEFVPIITGGENYVDCAMARILNKNNISPSIALVGNPKGVVKAELDEDVKKVGKITELTTGKVTLLNVTIETRVNGIKTIFKDQIITTKMSSPGDSGSILLNNLNYALGLAMCEGETLTCYNNITRVLNSMNVLLVTG